MSNRYARSLRGHFVLLGATSPVTLGTMEGVTRHWVSNEADRGSEKQGHYIIYVHSDEHKYMEVEHLGWHGPLVDSFPLRLPIHFQHVTRVTENQVPQWSSGRGVVVRLCGAPMWWAFKNDSGGSFIFIFFKYPKGLSSWSGPAILTETSTRGQRGPAEDKNKGLGYGHWVGQTHNEKHHHKTIKRP